MYLDIFFSIPSCLAFSCRRLVSLDVLTYSYATVGLVICLYVGESTPFSEIFYLFPLRPLTIETPYDFDDYVLSQYILYLKWINLETQHDR